MASVVTYPHIEKPEGKPARLSRQPRIRVAQIVIDYIDRRWTPEEMVVHYPHLELAEVYAAMTYTSITNKRSMTKSQPRRD